MGFESSAGLGVRNHYGVREIVDSFGGQTSTGGFIKTAEWVFDWDNLPVNGLGQMEAIIPAGSTIVSSTLEVITAMAGTLGTLDVGLEEPNGTVINTTGLDVAVAQAVLVANASIPGNGALIGTAIGVDAQLLITGGGTITAGKFKVTVEYHQGDKDGSGRYTAGGVKA